MPRPAGGEGKRSENITTSRNPCMLTSSGMRLRRGFLPVTSPCSTRGESDTSALLMYCWPELAAPYFSISWTATAGVALPYITLFNPGRYLSTISTLV